MAEILRIFVSVTRDLDSERAVIGRALAELPVHIAVDIRRSPPLTPTLDEILARVDGVDRFYFLLGNDISAPAGVEWLAAWRLERSIFALRRAPQPTQAAQEFMHLSPLPWHDFRSPGDLARHVTADISQLLLEPTNRFGLTVTELEQLSVYLRRLQRQQTGRSAAHSRQESQSRRAAADPGGLEGGGLLLDDGQRDLRTGARLDA